MRVGILAVGFVFIGTGLWVACGDSGPSTLSNGLSLPPGQIPTGSTSSTSTATPVDGGGTTDSQSFTTDDAAVARDFSTDRSKFFGASRCAAANVQFCEDFESGTLDTGTWTVSGTAPVIDGIEAARGSKALHITRNGNGPSYIKESKTFPAQNDTYWGRAFVYFNQLPTVQQLDGSTFNYSHWTFIAASGTGTVGEIRVSGQMGGNGKSLFGVGTDSTASDAGTGDWTNSDNDPSGAPLPVPTKSWLCIEWEHAGGSTNETHFFWDATEHPSLETTATVHGGNQSVNYVLPQFTNVWLGWQEYQQTSTEQFEMWVDEIAIDPARIGCVI